MNAPLTWWQEPVWAISEAVRLRKEAIEQGWAHAAIVPTRHGYAVYAAGPPLDFEF